MDIQRGKPRRSHSKSRTGCHNCKQRKIKCDETKPVCDKCQKYKDTCSFLKLQPMRPATSTQASNPARSQGPTIASMLSDSMISAYSISSFSMLDMELLHFYTTCSVEALFHIADVVEIYRTTVVQLAFRYRFLMHAILAITALHLAHIRPKHHAYYLQASDTHSSIGISLVQPFINNLTPENCHACFAYSTVTFTHAWAAQDVKKPSTMFFKQPGQEDAIQWIKFQRGTNEILMTVFPILLNGPMRGVVVKWTGLPEDRPDPLLEEEEKVLGELSDAWKDSTLPTEQIEALDSALNKLRRVFSMLELNQDIGQLAVSLAWFSWISDPYLKMMEVKVPQALLISVYYCVVLSRIENVWWMEGKAENLYNTLAAELDGSWERWLEWPRSKIFAVRVRIH